MHNDIVTIDGDTGEIEISETEAGLILRANGFIYAPGAGWCAVGSPTVEDWGATHGRLYTVKQRINVLYARFFQFGRERFGTVIYQYVPQLTAWEVKTVQNWLSICNSIPEGRWRHELYMGHHDAVTALPPEKQDELLDRAVNEGMNVGQLRRMAEMEKMIARGDDEDYGEETRARGCNKPRGHFDYANLEVWIKCRHLGQVEELYEALVDGGLVEPVYHAEEL